MANVLNMASPPNYLGFEKLNMRKREETRGIEDRDRMRGILASLDDPQQASEALMRGGYLDQAGKVEGIMGARQGRDLATSQEGRAESAEGRAVSAGERSQDKFDFEMEMARHKQELEKQAVAKSRLGGILKAVDGINDLEQLESVGNTLINGELTYYEQHPELLPPYYKDKDFSELKNGPIEGRIEALKQIHDDLGYRINAGKEMWETLMDKQGNITAQRNTTTGKVVADPRATAAADVPTGQTDLGKLTADRMNGLISQEQYDKKSKDAVDNVSDGDFKDEMGLRKEYNNLSKAYFDVQGAHDRVIASIKDPSAAGDLSLVFNYMKMLDPGSTVREGEFATAAASAGWGQRIIAAQKKIASGERLSDKQREDFGDRAEKLWDAAKITHKTTKDRYEKLAEGYGLDPERVVSMEDNDEEIKGFSEGQTATNPETQEKMIFYKR